VATDPRSVILDQVSNGVSVRMAVLFMLLGSGIDLAPDQSGADQGVDG
jgi:aspartate carbamoyltransferase catalytic subunit